ncbi:MAG: TIGR02757 family protein [Epsilonproteobacteria bacterium]|nr:TIGR02757 family protein [Campylobacterota bacterium]
MSSSLKEQLEREYQRFNSEFGLATPDPIWVAREFKDEKVALTAALFAYGNAKRIVKFLKGLDFKLLLEGSEKEILKTTAYYRFQKPLDVANFFITLKRATSLKEIFLKGYRKEHNVLEGLKELISYLKSLNSYSSYGYNFLLGSPPSKISGGSPYKRWNMFLRWMVRKDNIDLGLWGDEVRKSDLLIPLDTHTFKVSSKLGLLKRKTYDLKAVLELTNKLKEFDPNDPTKYDFALYRMGQKGLSLDSF